MYDTIVNIRSLVEATMPYTRLIIRLWAFSNRIAIHRTRTTVGAASYGTLPETSPGFVNAISRNNGFS